LLLTLALFLSGLPEIDTEKEDESTARLNSNKTSVFQFPHLLLGVLTLFLYIGAEVIAGDTIISYGKYHEISLSVAKFFTTYTLIFMIAGYLTGIALIPRYLSQQKALLYCAVLGIVFSLFALFTTGFTSVFFISLLGLANSLMWPALWPLALADLGRYTKTASSLLIMGLAGGAMIPLLYGKLADIYSPQQAYWILIPCYAFIFYYARSGHKIRMNSNAEIISQPQTTI
jgi:MFS transporter, FHS family, L-fucose permease